MKVLEALKNLLPEDKVNELEPLVEGWLDEAKQELEAEYNKNLEEAYADMTKQLKESEETGEKGYQEAYQIIQDLYSRLETQQAEFEKALEEGYEEAYQMIQSEKGKNESIGAEIYEEYDNKLQKMKEFMIDKIDEFLQYKGKELYEQARRDLVNDPQLAEQKVAMDKVINVLSDYISNDDYTEAKNSKLEQALGELEKLRESKRMLEHKNMMLSTQNKKLNESVKVLQEQVTEDDEEQITESRKVREEKAKNATGRGDKVTQGTKVIAEYASGSAAEGQDVDDEDLNINEADLHQMRVLSGLAKGK
jgi:hypothetical protein